MHGCCIRRACSLHPFDTARRSSRVASTDMDRTRGASRTPQTRCACRRRTDRSCDATSATCPVFASHATMAMKASARRIILVLHNYLALVSRAHHALMNDSFAIRNESQHPRRGSRMTELHDHRLRFWNEELADPLGPRPRRSRRDEPLDGPAAGHATTTRALASRLFPRALTLRANVPL